MIVKDDTLVGDDFRHALAATLLSSELSNGVVAPPLRYGAYVVDMHGGSAPLIFYADPASVSPDTINPLRNDDLDRIMPAVRVVP